tara:strand:+ start:1394 stop:1948 length:555 start_codon:yes stop_codon:yes gene_type:complete
MKNNLVKIVATFGLIVVIAVILKSVFGIGKIGVSKITNSDNSKNIIFDKCWRAKELTSDGKIEIYNKSRKDSQINGKWENQKFEIDLKNNIIIFTITITDEAVEKRKKLSLPASKIFQEKIQIEDITDEYIRSVPKDTVSLLGKKMLGRHVYTFRLNTGTVEQLWDHPNFPQTFILECDETLGL